MYSGAPERKVKLEGIKSVKDIQKIVSESKEYDFIRKDPHLQNSIILLGLGGLMLMECRRSPQILISEE